VIIPRTAWQTTTNPIAGTPAVPHEWRYNTLHYCGVDVNTSDPVRLLRNMQTAWTNQKGYSLGYNFAVFTDGSSYEIRGLDLRCAANGDQTSNRPGVAILLAIPAIDGQPTDPMIEAVRDLVAHTRARVPQSLLINGHREVRPSPTACPGQTIMHMIEAGVFEPTTEPLEEAGMIFRTTATADAIFAQGSDMSVRHVTAQEGAVAQAGNPGWADGAPTLELPADVTDWLATL
jgi:hypothetical protein